MHCSDLAQDRGKFWAVVNMAMSTVLPEYIRNLLTTWETISFSRRTLLLGLNYGHQGRHPTDTPPNRSPLPTALWASSVTTVDCIWNVMAHVQKPDFVSWRNRQVHLNQWGCQFSRLLCTSSCAHQPVGFVLLVQACVLQSSDAYWLPTPFSCFPFTSPPVHHRVPSHFNRTLTPHHYNPAVLMFSSDPNLLSFSSGAKYMKATQWRVLTV